MEKMDFSTLIFALGIITFFVVLTAVKIFSLSVDTTSLMILLFITVCVAAFSRIEKYETEEAKK